MSYLSTALTACPNVQERANEIFQFGDTLNGQIFEPMPFLEFVAGTSALDQRINSGEGRIRTVEILYDQFILESDVDSNVDNPVCVASDVRGNCSQTYEIDTTQNIGVGEKITLSHFRQQCESNPDYFARVMLKLINAADRKTATKTATQATGLTGKWNENEGANIDGITSFTNDELVIPTLKSDGDMEPFTMEAINAALMVSLYDSSTFLVGGFPLYQYYRRMLAGCCANQGVDLADIQAQYGYAVAYDKRIASAFAADETLAIRAGALQLVRFNQAPWIDDLPNYFKEARDYTHFVMTSPQTGIPYDVSIKDDCGTVHINVVGTTKLFGAPSDMFPTGSDYDGITFANVIKVTNP